MDTITIPYESIEEKISQKLDKINIFSESMEDFIRYIEPRSIDDSKMESILEIADDVLVSNENGEDTEDTIEPIITFPLSGLVKAQEKDTIAKHCGGEGKQLLE